MDDFEFERKKRWKLKKKPMIVGLCILCLMIGTIGGYFLSRIFFVPRVEVQPGLYQEIGTILENYFLDTTDSQLSVAERMAMGMVAALGDPYSSYLSIKQSEELGTSINGNFQGIGVTFRAVDGGAVVLKVYENTPAKKAGLLNGDMITHVQGTAVGGFDAEKIKNMIQGKAGENVKLTILRKGKTFDVEVTRGAVETSVYYEVRKKDQIPFGYLEITTFGETTAADVEKALKTFKKQNIEHLVIDLRDNGGGYLVAAKEILDLFIKEGDVLYKVDSTLGELEVQKASDVAKYSFKHGYILTNGSTASASEVVTACLKAHLHYQTIGEKTFGKGIVQTQKTLSNDSVLKFTYAKWLTPEDQCVQGQGIEADYPVSMKTLDDFAIVSLDKDYKYDEVHDIIAYMQESLKELGYKVDRQDGYFSKQTEVALKAFEKDHGLSVDGIYSQKDATLLLNALSYHLYQENDDVQYQKVLELIKE